MYVCCAPKVSSLLRLHSAFFNSKIQWLKASSQVLREVPYISNYFRGFIYRDGVEKAALSFLSFPLIYCCLHLQWLFLTAILFLSYFIPTGSIITDISFYSKSFSSSIACLKLLSLTLSCWLSAQWSILLQGWPPGPLAITVLYFWIDSMDLDHIWIFGS